MSDTIPATPTDQTGPLDAGHTTTEYAMSKWASILTGSLAILTTAASLLEKVVPMIPEGFGKVGLWAGFALATITGLIQFLYGLQRLSLKTAALKAGVRVAAPVAADPGSTLGRV